MSKLFKSWLILIALFVGLAGCAETRTHESTGEYVDDSAITTRVKTALVADATLGTAARINVETYKGIVQLSGFANSRSEADKAVSIASNTRGVKSVKNDIVVK